MYFKCIFNVLLMYFWWIRQAASPGERVHSEKRAPEHPKTSPKAFHTRPNLDLFRAFSGASGGAPPGEHFEIILRKFWPALGVRGAAFLKVQQNLEKHPFFLSGPLAREQLKLSFAPLRRPALGDRQIFGTFALFFGTKGPFFGTGREFIRKSEPQEHPETSPKAFHTRPNLEYFWWIREAASPGARVCLMYV